MNQTTIESAYKAIADLTLGHCKRTCNRMGSCCSGEYCDMAIDFAKEFHDITLTRTENKSLPLLDAEGRCTAAPHLRPLCSRHSCDINGLGFFKNEPELTVAYFKLCDVASVLELKLYEKHLESSPESLSI